jgi:hypothetical protein
VRKLSCLCLHHTATATGDVERFRREHRAKGWSDIGYHGLILPDGVFQQGRPDEQVGAGVYGANTGLLHVALIGQFDKHSPGFTGRPTKAQLATLGGWLLDRNWKYAGRFARPALEVAGHREKALPTHPTVCPGSEFPLADVRRWFEHYAMVWRPGETPTVSLGEFVERGGTFALLDEVTRLTEQPRRLKVIGPDFVTEVPCDDWEIRQGQTWVRLRALCNAAGLTVEADGADVLVRADR